MDEVSPKSARTAPPPPTSDRSGSGSGNGGQQDNNCDRISELPDGVLGVILFLLPLKEAGRTTILSTRWRSVFTSSPVALDDEQVGRRRLGRRPREEVLHAERVDVINRILATHKGPIPRVRVAKTCFRCDGNGVGLRTDAFAARGVEELIVHSTQPVKFFPAPPLRSLQLILCDWFSQEPPAAILTRLKELTLRAVKISERDLHALLDQCVTLESLFLSSYHKYHGTPEQVAVTRFRVLSRSLRSLSLELCELEELVIVDAPNLERLLGEPRYDRRNCKVTFVNAPKLQVLGFLTVQPYLADYSAFYEVVSGKGMYVAMPGQMESVTMLAVCVNVCGVAQIWEILHFLNYFPCVETLHIKLLCCDPPKFHFPIVPYANYLEQAGLVVCLRDHVKTIVLSPLFGCETEVEFAKILLESAKVLKVMRILCKTMDKATIKSIKHRLGLENNAHLNAQVRLSRNSIFRDSIHDVVLSSSSLAITDPFFVQMGNSDQ